MGIEIEVNSLDEMCDLMCYNKIPERRKQMIKAKVTIFDDEKGIVYDKDKLIPPSKHTVDGYRDIYLFKFEYARLIDDPGSAGDEMRQNNYDRIQNR